MASKHLEVILFLLIDWMSPSVLQLLSQQEEASCDSLTITFTTLEMQTVLEEPSQKVCISPWPRDAVYRGT